MVLIQVRKLIRSEFSIWPDSPSVNFVSVSQYDSGLFWYNKFFDFISFWNAREVYFFEDEDIFFWLQSLLKSFFLDFILIVVFFILWLFFPLIFVNIFLLFFIWVIIVRCVVIVIFWAFLVSILVCVHFFAFKFCLVKLSNFYKSLSYHNFIFLH